MKKILISALFLTAIVSCKSDKKKHSHDTDMKSTVETTAIETVENTEEKAKDLEEKLDKATKELNELLKDL